MTDVTHPSRIPFQLDERLIGLLNVEESGSDVKILCLNRDLFLDRLSRFLEGRMSVKTDLQHKFLERFPRLAWERMEVGEEEFKRMGFIAKLTSIAMSLFGIGIDLEAEPYQEMLARACFCNLFLLHIDIAREKQEARATRAVRMPNAEQPLPLDSYLKPSLVDVVTGPLAADDPPGFKSAVECFLVQHGRGDDYGRNLGGELIPRCWTPVRNSEDDDERLSWLAVTEYRIGIHPNTPDSMRLAVASCFAIPFEELNEVVLRLRAEQLAKQGSATVAA